MGRIPVGLVLIKNPAKEITIHAGNYLILITSGQSRRILENFFGVHQGE